MASGIISLGIGSPASIGLFLLFGLGEVPGDGDSPVVFEFDSVITRTVYGDSIVNRTIEFVSELGQ